VVAAETGAIGIISAAQAALASILIFMSNSFVSVFEPHNALTALQFNSFLTDPEKLFRK
jgi:hypothetical protein